MSTTPRTDDMSEPMPFRSMSASESEVRRALVSMTAERDNLVSKYQTAISCLADERRKKQAAIGDRDEWEKRYDEQTKLASEVIAQRDLANERVEAKQSEYERCADQLTAMTAERDALKAALKALLNHYVALVNSGDAGNWNPELETPVIRARTALGEEKS